MLNYIKMKHKNWILIAIFGAFLTAPNASVIKLVTSQVDPLYWNFSAFYWLRSLHCHWLLRTVVSY